MTLTNSENSDQTGLESEITLGLSPLQFDLLSFEQQGFVSQNLIYRTSVCKVATIFEFFTNI